MRGWCLFLVVLSVYALSSVAAAIEQPRRVADIELVGNSSIRTNDILECLGRLPAVLAAAERTNSDQDFVRAIEASILAGYKNAGFHNCRVETTAAAASWRLSITEGQRTLTGPIHIEGNAAVVEWLQQSIATFQENSDKFVWSEGKPWNGELNLSPEQTKCLSECLAGLGINPRLVFSSIKLDPNSSSNRPLLVLQVPTSLQPSRIESIKCSTEDREIITAKLAEQSIVVGSQFDSTTLSRTQQILLESTVFDYVTANVDQGHGLGDLILNIQTSRGEAATSDKVLARKNVLRFGRSLPQIIAADHGVKLTMSLGNAQGQMWLFEKRFAIQLQRSGVQVARVINNADTDIASIQTGNGIRYAFGIPNLAFNFGVRTTDHATKKVACEFNAQFQTDDNKAKANRFDLDLATLCNLFPLDESHNVEVADGTVIQSPRGRMHLTPEGKLRSLSITSVDQPDSVCLIELARQMPEDLQVMESSSVENLAFRIPHHVASPDNANKQKFFAARGNSDLTAAWTFWMVQDSLRYYPGSPIYELAEIFGIASTGDDAAMQAACDRWQAVHSEGPFSRMALAYCHATVGDSARAAELASSAMQMLSRDDLVRADLDYIFAEKSVIGDAARNVNARNLHLLVTQIATALDADPSFLELLKATEPPASEPLMQWKLLVERLIPSTLQQPMQSIAGQLQAPAARTASRP